MKQGKPVQSFQMFLQILIASWSAWPVHHLCGSEVYPGLSMPMACCDVITMVKTGNSESTSHPKYICILRIYYMHVPVVHKARSSGMNENVHV